MIEARTNGADTAPQAETPQIITVSMILEDLDNGTDRPGIQTKYGLKTWEVTEMFKHPQLKGRKAKKVRKLSFDFVDDTVETLRLKNLDAKIVDPNQISIPIETEESFDQQTRVEEGLDHKGESFDEEIEELEF